MSRLPEERIRPRWHTQAVRAAVIVFCLVLAAIVGVLGYRVWGPPEQQKSSNRDFEQAKANVIRLTAWAAGVPENYPGHGLQHGCATGTVGEGPPWTWSEEYDVPYSEQRVQEITDRLRQLRDQGWHYVETQKVFEEVHTKLAVHVSSNELVSIDMWRSSRINIEDDAKAGKPPESHTINISGLSECTS